MSRVLVVDGETDASETLACGLQQLGYSPQVTTSADDALRETGEHDFDAVLTDAVPRGMSGLELCERLVDTVPDLPVIVMSGLVNLESAVAALRAGAYDFLAKPVELPLVARALTQALRERSLRQQAHRVPQVLGQDAGSGELLGNSAPMRKLRQFVAQVADSDAPVLISGESGTGKELVARALHHQGSRLHGPFVALNCAAIPEGLLESQLFGHVQGAFTDARRAQAGLLLDASGGTLFLDEIGEMPLTLQAKLLRAVEQHRVRPVGGSAEIPFDARIVSATNRNLEVAVRERTFRDDLYYRLDVIQVALPPLRARGDDVLLLAQHFVEQYAQTTGKAVDGLFPGAARRLLAYSWPGNVRELQNVIQHAGLLTRYRRLGVEDLPLTLRGGIAPPQPAEGPVELVSAAEMERRHILRVLQAVGDNRSMAAHVLGLDRRTLYRKLKNYAQSPETADAQY